jgi:hypothetical protein
VNRTKTVSFGKKKESTGNESLVENGPVAPAESIMMLACKMVISQKIRHHHHHHHHHHHSASFFHQIKTIHCIKINQ